MKYEDLNIQEIQGSPPVACCNICGHKNKIKFCGSHPEDEDILIFVCSDSCNNTLQTLFKIKYKSLIAFFSELFHNVQELKKTK